MQKGKKNKISKDDISICAKSCEDSMEELLRTKLKDHINKLNGLKRGNLYDIVLKCMEKPLIQMVLEETKWNQKRSSEILGINRNTLRKKINDLNISKHP